MIRSRYVQVLLNQDMSFFDTYGNNGDIVSQVLSDVLLIQSALSEKVSAAQVILVLSDFLVCFGTIHSFSRKKMKNVQLRVLMPCIIILAYLLHWCMFPVSAYSFLLLISYSYTGRKLYS